MRTVASIYNPDLLTKEQLIRSFVVRIKKFEKLFTDIKSAKMEHPEQPILVVGLRGMGKTTLLLRLAYEVENDEALKEWLLPIVFNEEEYGVTRLFKFWETITEYLEQKDPAFSGLYDQMDKAYNLQPGPVKYEQAAFALLLQALHQQKKKLLLFIDNFGDMFKRFDKQERQRLREVLTTCPDIRIIAGSAVAVESFFKYDDPLYELFKIERLEGLTREETEALLLQLVESFPVNPVKEILEKQPQRIETLRRLTGGIPRTMVLLFEIFVDDKDGNAFTDLENILDRVTPLYKHRMDGLRPQQQEIINAIAHNWDAISAGEIAQKTRLESKLVSAELQQLKQRKIVNVVPSGSKNHLYQLRDRFFNIWYLMYHTRKGTKEKVLWFIQFQEKWFQKEGVIQKNESRSPGNQYTIPEESYSPDEESVLKETNHPYETRQFLKADLFGMSKLQEERMPVEITDSAIAFMILLLAKKEYSFLYNYFTGEKGREFQLKDRFKPLWYALMYYMQGRYPTEYLRMPPEIRETVEEVIARVERKRKDYEI